MYLGVGLLHKKLLFIYLSVHKPQFQIIHSSGRNEKQKIQKHLCKLSPTNTYELIDDPVY